MKDDSGLTMDFYRDANGNEGIKWLAEIGDEVEVRGKIVTVVSLSIGHKPELYRVEASNGQRAWISRAFITPIKEKVIFS